MIQFRNWFFLPTGIPGTRFLKGNKPTEAVMRDFLQSITFKKESSDTATISAQGLTKLENDTDAANRDSTPDADLFSKTVRSHQLPNVLPGTGILVTPVVQAIGRTGGLGKDFTVNNSMIAASNLVNPNNPIITTQAGPGEDVLLDFDETKLTTAPGKVKTDATDDTAGYLADEIVSDNTGVLDVTVDATLPDHKLLLTPKRGIGEIIMYSRTVAQLAVDFPGSNIAVQGAGGNYNTTNNSAWKGFAFCDGGTYNGEITPDLRGSFPVGYSSPLYPNLGIATANQDNTAKSGENTHVLVKGEIPKHTHGAGTLVNSSAGSHSHNFQNDTGGFNPGANPALTCDQTVPDCTLPTDAVGNHTHTITGDTEDGTVTGLKSPSDAHENRPPFITVLFLKYVGY